MSQSVLKKGSDPLHLSGLSPLSAVSPIPSQGSDPFFNTLSGPFAGRWRRRLRTRRLAEAFQLGRQAAKVCLVVFQGPRHLIAKLRMVQEEPSLVRRGFRLVR